jgi:hypothetical protein
MRKKGMKTCIRKGFLLFVLIVLGSTLAGQVSAQTFTVLHSLTVGKPDAL